MAYVKSHGECLATGKKIYFTENDATTAAKYTIYQNKLRGKDYILEPFKCEHCGYWHFGKKKEEVSTLEEYVEETKVLTTEEMVEKLRSLGYAVTPPEQVVELKRRLDFYKKFVKFYEENV